jgi:hypothetical protein
VTGEILYHSVNRLGRHPSELDLTLGEMYDVVWAGREADKVENQRWEALIKSLAGRVL